MQSLCARKAEEDSDDRRKCDEGNGVDLGEQLLPGENDDSQKDRLEQKQIGNFMTCHKGIDIDQGYLGNIETGCRDHGDGSRAKAVESVLDMLAAPELLQEAANDQDDDQRGRRSCPTSHRGRGA